VVCPSTRESGGRPVKKSVIMLCVVGICRLDCELWLEICGTAMLAAGSLVQNIGLV
jgi:hypothetical protein